MNRRGFLGSILALGAAPAIVRADSLMRLIPRDLSLLLPLETQRAASSAMWAGTIREMTGFDIVRDETIKRFDVMVACPDGSLEQLGVDIRIASGDVETASAREAALAVLKQHAAKAGRPLRGVIALPKHMDSRILN
jgi:hypothetical protein